MKYLKITSVLLLTLLALGCPPGGPGNGEGMGEGAGEGQGEMPVPDAADHFFVDGARGNDANTARRAAPLATIQEAIDRATDQGGSVYVAGGTYAETLQLASAVEIRGGYDSLNWTRDRENSESMIAGGTSAVVGDNVMNALIEGFVIVSADATEPGGGSTALALRECADIEVRDVLLLPGNGAAGADGADGDPGIDGPVGGDGANAAACTGSVSGGAGAQPYGNLNFSAGDGGSGNLGAGSDGGDSHGPAMFIAAGGDGGAGGGIGQDGDLGGGGNTSLDVGAPGEGGANVGVFDGFAYTPANGEVGNSGGAGGSGGGGGGGGGAVVFACGGGGGGGGGAGRGGRGGEGGIGGGASVGVLLDRSANVRLIDCMIATGDGGEGGTGGDGGPNGLGARGGNGGNRFGAQGAGGNGGHGGDGADGGPGGGGGGGPALGIILDAASELTQTNTTITVGTPGLGGMSLSGPDFFGADGLSAELYQVPGADGTRSANPVAEIRSRGK